MSAQEQDCRDVFCSVSCVSLAVRGWGGREGKGVKSTYSSRTVGHGDNSLLPLQLLELWTHANPLPGWFPFFHWPVKVSSATGIAAFLVASAPAGGCYRCHPCLGSVPQLLCGTTLPHPRCGRKSASTVPCREVIFKYKTVSFLRKSCYSSEQKWKLQEAAAFCFASLFTSPKMLTLGASGLVSAPLTLTI